MKYQRFSSISSILTWKRRKNTEATACLQAKIPVQTISRFSGRRWGTISIFASAILRMLLSVYHAENIGGVLMFMFHTFPVCLNDHLIRSGALFVDNIEGTGKPNKMVAGCRENRSRLLRMSVSRISQRNSKEWNLRLLIFPRESNGHGMSRVAGRARPNWPNSNYVLHFKPTN
jgi:hypothetical protein